MSDRIVIDLSEAATLCDLSEPTLGDRLGGYYWCSADAMHERNAEWEKLRAEMRGEACDSND
jgi:hypothetical protein